MTAVGSIVVAGGVSPLPEWHGISIGVFFPFAFVGLWILFSFFISRLGWMRFAMAHRCQDKPSGTRFSVSAVTFGGIGARYNSAVRAVATESGLYLHPVLLFRAFHPPFTIPWRSIEQAEPYRFMRSHGYVLRVRDEAGTFEMHIDHKAAHEIGRFVPHLFAAPSDC